jgi:SAM-dependent methyltransferase
MIDIDEKSYVYIDEKRRIYEGKDATRLLRAKNDIGSIDLHKGIIRVSSQRWEEAQRYELCTWLRAGRGAVDDRNEYHSVHFANYSNLRGLKFKRGIELGCGPFTNIRLILEHCDIEEVHLLDPLLENYLSHPHCRFRGGKLGGLLKESPALQYIRHPQKFLLNIKNAWKIGNLFGQPINLHNSMIETFQTDLKYDLIVMINVLEHCQDAEAVFAKILDLLSPSGIFVFHDVLYNVEQTQRLAAIIYDAGHPLQVEISIINQFLEQYFTPLMHAEYNKEDNFKGIQWNRTDLYFIGKRQVG